jgi:crotonobetainyl-CoA:carnitine CoA-transferase CaiB-like acyl-CoA transferase
MGSFAEQPAIACGVAPLGTRTMGRGGRCMRVLEFGAGVAGAYCGKLFALWGADVVRIDLPGTRPGDPRGSALDVYLHANKRRLALDYGVAEGRALLARLTSACDVVVCDGPASAFDQLDWRGLVGASKPGVAVAITPFGFTGPYRNWHATDATLLALGGYTFLMGDPGRAPLTLPGNYVSYQAGQFAYIGARAALLAGRQTADVEVCMLEAVASLSQFTTVMWSYRQQVRSRHGNDWENIHPISLYPCRDGWFAVNVVPGFWRAFTEMLGRPDLLEDPRFATNEARTAHKRELDDIIVAALGDRSAEEILDLGQRQFRVPTGALRRMQDLLDDPHLTAREFWQPLARPDGAPLRIAASAFRYAGEPAPEQRLLSHLDDAGALWAGPARTGAR